MGDTTFNKSSEPLNQSADYVVNDEGSVTNKRAARPRTQTSSFIINEDGSVTKRSVHTKKVQNTAQPSSKRDVASENIRDKSSSIVSTGTVLYIIATIIFYILLIINTYEENETVGDWIMILLGLSFFAVLLYSIIIRPILTWLEDLL